MGPTPPWEFRDPAGNLYGTTRSGGSANAGVVYKVDAAGHEKILYNFTGGPDGGFPAAGVILDPAGNLYGTTYGGGTGNVGVVYKLDTAGHETVLHSFTGGADGTQPSAALIRDSAGNLYGTTSYGGVNGWGLVYILDTADQLTVLQKLRYPELVACELHNDLGLDAYASASLAPDGRGKGVACSITGTLEKISSDAAKVRKHYGDVSLFLFYTSEKVSQPKKAEWADQIRKDYEYELVILSREGSGDPTGAGQCCNLQEPSETLRFLMSPRCLSFSDRRMLRQRRQPFDGLPPAPGSKTPNNSERRRYWQGGRRGAGDLRYHPSAHPVTSGASSHSGGASGSG
jgi:uncharacterized repeat protein (TIGR03803 family)